MCLTRARHAFSVENEQLGCPVAVVPTTFAQNLAAFAESQGQRTNPAERSAIVAKSVAVNFDISASLYPTPGAISAGLGSIVYARLLSGHLGPSEHTTQRKGPSLARLGVRRHRNDFTGCVRSKFAARDTGHPRTACATPHGCTIRRADCHTWRGR